MLTGPKFARASYILFTIAVLAALLKLGGIAGVEPFILRTAPATSVARAAEPVVRENPADVRLDLPERRYTLGGHLLPELTNPPDVESSDAPIFYRPSPKRKAEGNPSQPVCTDLGGFPEGSRAIFPLPEDYLGSYEDTWGAARPQGGHEGTDLMSPAGTPEFAITDGTIVRVSGASENGWNRLGGYTVMLKADYDVGPIKKGDLFYYAHLNEESSLPIGTKVRAGQRMGFAGDTGEGREGTRGEFPAHLHLGWYDTSSASDRANLKSGAMNPYPLLLWLENNGGAVAGGTDATYCEAQGPEPSTDEGSSSAQRDPDLDTGDADDARPSPVVEESRHDNSPERQSKQNEKKAPANPGKNKAPADKPRKHDETEDSREKSSAASEAQVTRPSSLEAKTRSLLSDPRPGWASRSSSVVAGVLRGEMDDDGQETDAPDEKEKQKPPNPPEDKEPETSVPEPTKPRDQAPPTPRKPEKFDEPSAPCDKVANGHDAYVTRDQNQRTQIKHSEWLALVKNDPELRACKNAGANRKARYEGLAIWTGHPDHEEVRFYLRGGNVVVEAPDEPTLMKMREIASALDAKVMDNDVPPS